MVAINSSKPTDKVKRECYNPKPNDLNIQRSKLFDCVIQYIDENAIRMEVPEPQPEKKNDKKKSAKPISGQQATDVIPFSKLKLPQLPQRAPKQAAVANIQQSATLVRKTGAVSIRKTDETPPHLSVIDVASSCLVRM